MIGQTIIECLDAMNRHAAHVRAVAGLLEHCREEDLPGGVLRDAAGLIFEEIKALQTWTRKLENELRR